MQGANVMTAATAPTEADDAPTTSLGGATIILPAFNEERGVAAMLHQLGPLRERGAEVIVVDDGSTDRTAAVAEASGVRVVRRRRNGGKGAAIRSGARAATGSKLVVMDADATYPVAAIPEMLRLLDDHDIVLGVRDVGRGNIPLLNRLGNAALRVAIRLVSGFRSADPLTGLYAVRRESLLAMSLDSRGFGIEAEIAIKSAHLRLRATDHPVGYHPRIGDSKLNPIRDGWVIAATIGRVALQRRRTRRSARRPT